jgi:hypothetical protein
LPRPRRSRSWGPPTEVHGSEKEQGLQLFLAKHPYLQDFVSAPSCALLKVKVAKYILVSQFQEVREMYPGPMNHVLNLADIRPRDRRVVGGKAFSLAVLAQNGIKVPLTLVVTTRAYHDFVSAAGLKGRILMELGRKSFKDLRWEEIWDISLRIRHMFLTTPLPAGLAASLGSGLGPHLPERCVVRSSAPGEDSPQASFAGLHASFVNVSGIEAVLDHIKLVWASLWSDAALLYRRELGLNVQKSAMAVIVQEIVEGEKSGVVFGQNPQDDSQAVIEAVYGLNQGLVDGAVEPDRWLLDRETGAVAAYHPAPKESFMAPGEEGVRLAPLPPGAPPHPAVERGRSGPGVSDGPAERTAFRRAPGHGVDLCRRGPHCPAIPAHHPRRQEGRRRSTPLVSQSAAKF